jgi:hypothetical protein
MGYLDEPVERKNTYPDHMINFSRFDIPNFIRSLKDCLITKKLCHLYSNNSIDSIAETLPIRLSRPIRSRGLKYYKPNKSLN